MPIVNEGVLQEMKHIANPSELKHIQELYEQTEPLMQEIAYALITGNDKEVDQLTSKALDSGFTANTVMDDGLIAGMAIVGIKFRDNIILFGKMITCSDRKGFISSTSDNKEFLNFRYF